eukprot:maker-scaffold359_size197282-snap-gene-0.28 protein:Tk01283 transcript:maker-scaffold359_size197282-snap-gene-0.28-mRNA-1 annotation:"hypothetical protein CAPTEDRAFT_108175"
MAKGHAKSEERQIRASHRRQRKEQRRADPSQTQGDFVSLRNQLAILGLTLKEVPGDGNCLFRALSDQIHGSSEQHGHFRRNVVDFMRHHRADFEPFLVDEPSFERHLELLEQDGTFGGNDSIVALARLQGVTIVIHQLNEALWQVHGSPDGSACPRELHISYHNGDHYNSVRRMGDIPGRGPANVKIHASKTHQPLPPVQDEMDSDISDYENASTTELENLKKVMRLSGVEDMAVAADALFKNADCAESAVDYLLQLNSNVNHPARAQFASKSSGVNIAGMAESQYTRSLLFVNWNARQTKHNHLDFAENVWLSFLRDSLTGNVYAQKEKNFLNFVTTEYDSDVSDDLSGEEGEVDTINRDAIKQLRVHRRRGRKSSSRQTLERCPSRAYLESIRHENPYMSLVKLLSGNMDEALAHKRLLRLRYQELKLQDPLRLEKPFDLFQRSPKLDYFRSHFRPELFTCPGTTWQDAKEFLKFVGPREKALDWLKQVRQPMRMDRRAGMCLYLSMMPTYLHRRTQFILTRMCPPIPKVKQRAAQYQLGQLPFFRRDLLSKEERRAMTLWYTKIIEYVLYHFEIDLEVPSQIMSPEVVEVTRTHATDCEKPTCEVIRRGELRRTEAFEKLGAEWYTNYTGYSGCMWMKDFCIAFFFVYIMLISGLIGDDENGYDIPLYVVQF